MADGKRASGGPKIPVATPNIGGLVNTVPLETALAGCIGARIRITTTSNAALEGTLFTADPLTNLIVINTAPPPPTPASASTSPQPGDYHIIPVSRLQTFQLLALAPEVASAAPDGGPVSFGNALPGIRKLDRNVLAGREKAAVERDMRRERARGRGVGKEGQDIYDALSRTLPVRWNEQTIIVLDVVLIEPPYGLDDCKSPSMDETALQRVKKVLEMEKKKFAERQHGTINHNANNNKQPSATTTTPTPNTTNPALPLPSSTMTTIIPSIPIGAVRKGG